MTPHLRIVTEPEPRGPSRRYLALTRNPALVSPTKFVPTRKRDGDVVI